MLLLFSIKSFIFVVPDVVHQSTYEYRNKSINRLYTNWYDVSVALCTYWGRTVR